ncbi:MAG: TatD family hydrolase [Candidatus Pacebacteria bacterium]|nr:TatD family hydrolase [Candidatus Paceibacterota bacterium]
MIIDTHVHYNLEPLFPDWKIHWEEAQKHDIKKSVIIGTDEETNARAIAIAESQEHLYAALGIHPTEQFSESECLSSFSKLERQIRQSKKIVAIGECGLDFFRLPVDKKQKEEEKKRQCELFQKHIELAHQHKLPLVIHCRDAHQELIETLSSFEVQKFVLHCMSGTLEYLQQAIALGGYISFAGNITYKNGDHLRELVKITPKNRLLVETDAPYLPPSQWRGQINIPKYITETVNTLTAILGISVDECRTITTQNAEHFFHI